MTFPARHTLVPPMLPEPDRYKQARRLGFWGLLARWEAVVHEPWLVPLLDTEWAERQHRSLERRLAQAHLGPFKPMADFQWDWPTKLDRTLVEELLTCQFVREATNGLIIGPNGIGKTMIGINLAHQAILAGFTVGFTTASAMLNDLAAQEGMYSFRRRVARYVRPQLLVIDEVGSLSYDNRHADLLFEVINQRYQKRSTVVTTNKPFHEWNAIFPTAACIVTLLDRLTHCAEIVTIEGQSFRLKETNELAAQRAAQRAQSRLVKGAKQRLLAIP
jgi:DNA replication protein DnaC